MKRIVYIILLNFIISLVSFSARAVTEKEMEEARTIAAQAYLRYANDGSGYLDAVKAKTMAELEKNLKPKEKENIKAFKAIAVPSDYKAWDKQKLVDYWGVKAFSTPGLLEKGRIGKSRAKKNINAMTVTPPSKEGAKESTTATSAPAVVPEATPNKEDAKTAAEAPKAEEKAAPASQPEAVLAADSTAADALAQAEAAAEAISRLEDEPEIQKADNHTWIYIVVLCVLIAVVCALVVFASNVMKRNGDSSERKDGMRMSSIDSANSNSIREKFAATLTAKNEEIKTLSKKIENVNAENASLKTKMEGLTVEVASLRSRLAEANLKIVDMQKAANAVAANLVASLQSPTQGVATQGEPARQTVPLRTIYLGMATPEGIFVRADRDFNPGKSVYRLDSTDGYAGSFRVANETAAWDMALQRPAEILSGGCVIADGATTEGKTKIVTDSSGTAVFEDKRWKVIRKAKVHFE